MSTINVDNIKDGAGGDNVAMPAGSIVQVGTQVAVESLNDQITTTSFTAVGNSFIASITPRFASSKIRVIMTFQTYSSSNYSAVNIYRSVAGGTYAAISTYPMSNGGYDWEAKSLIHIDSPTYSVGQTIQYQPYQAGHNASNAVYFGWGSSGRGSSCLMHCEEIKG